MCVQFYSLRVHELAYSSACVCRRKRVFVNEYSNTCGIICGSVGTKESTSRMFLSDSVALALPTRAPCRNVSLPAQADVSSLALTSLSFELYFQGLYLTAACRPHNNLSMAHRSTLISRLVILPAGKQSKFVKKRMTLINRVT